MSEKLWDGRFSERTDQSVEAFTSSIDFDRRLYACDIVGSIAHCRMLAATGVILPEEAETLVDGLGQISREIERGDFQFDDSLEDIHMHVEARLLQLVGKVAQKLHTARSRNDQVALDIRIYLRAESREAIRRLHRLRRVLVEIAAANTDVVMPGFTHMQRAQPVLLSHHLLAYYEMFSRDSQRFADGLERINVLPLGCAALAGTPYPIDRDQTAEMLGFDRVAANSMDAVSDRDFAIEFLSAASIAMMHLSRLSEELILWATSEFGFVELPDAFATGSSIMPQKKNPDVAELVRGKTGRVYGHLVALLTLMKAQPLAYNRDMQEDKPPLFDTVDTLKACLAIYTRMLPRIGFKRDAMARAASSGFLNATDMADYLAERGVPFRKAHGIVGRAVSYALERGKELQELSLEELQSFAAAMQPDIYDYLETTRVIDRRTSAGGTATANVKTAAAAAAAALDAEEGES